ncbi:hypothetical protein PT974_07238 [Cladobotryum mycophilum]|uniref:Amidohydrolase-related domain-containing protein n=1 Tax=Cladobotryum mycophilum TaxID=491253 RepID=A0ABR0SQ12_9HYPO
MTIYSVKNVQLFDGDELNDSSTLTFQGSPGDILPTETDPDVAIDGTGCTLLPGFIDSKVDADASVSALSKFAAAGVTTVIDSSSGSAEAHAMRGAASRDPISPSYFASGSAVGAVDHEVGGIQFPYRAVERVASVDEARRCVRDRATGPTQADYIKAIVDQPGLSLEALTAIVETAHQYGKLAVGHASRVDAYRLALDAGFDIVTPVPLDAPLGDDVIEGFLNKGITVIPTLCFLKKMVHSRQDYDYSHAVASVKALHRAGVRICAGTAANRAGSLTIHFGESLHYELRLLVEAGLSIKDALRSATHIPAIVFRLRDRGAIETGSRADLILVEGNPLEDLSALSHIRQVWIRGVEVPSK